MVALIPSVEAVACWATRLTSAAAVAAVAKGSELQLTWLLHPLTGSSKDQLSNQRTKPGLHVCLCVAFN